MPDQQDVLLSAARSAFDIVSGAASTRLAVAHLASLIGEERLPRDLRRRAAPPDPLAFKEVERVLKAAWGRAPGKVLADLSSEPVAVTPAAQVHRGETEDGAAVAVKLRRPGLTEMVRSDLVLVEAAAGAFSGFFPRVDMGAVLRELRERLMDELDLEYEAATQRRFARALRGHERLFVPMPVMDLCEEAVLVSAWVDGTPLRRLAGDGQAAAELLVEFAATVPGLVGVAIADPHHDDALLMNDGRLAVVDFGAVREVAPERVALARRAMAAARDRDADALAAVVDESGWLPGCPVEDAQYGIDLADELLGAQLRGEAPLTARALEDAILGLEPHAERILAIARRGSAVPEDLWPFRGIGQLGLVLAGLGATGDWLALGAEHL